MPARGRRPAVELEDEAWELVDGVPLCGWENDLGDAVLCEAVATAAVVGTPLASAKALDDDDDGGFDFVDGARAASSSEKGTKVNAVSSAAAAASLVSASSEELTASPSSSTPPCASGYWYSRHALVVVLSLFAAVAIGGRPSSSLSLSPHSRLPLSPSSPARPTDGNGTVSLLERRVAAMERELELERAPPRRPLHCSEPSAAAAGEETPPADARRPSGEMVAAATNAARSAEEEDDEAAAAEEEDDDAAAAAAAAYSRQFARLPTTEAHVGIACGPGSYYLGDPTVTRRFPAVTTERAAAATVAALARADPSNPPIVWQLTDPWWSATRRARAPHLVVHLAKFLDQRLDGDTGKPLAELSSFVMLRPRGDLPMPSAATPIFYFSPDGDGQKTSAA